MVMTGSLFEFFYLCLLVSLSVFEYSTERTVNGDGGMTSSLTITSRMLCCVNFASLVTALSACCLTTQVTGTVKGDDLAR